MNIFDKTYKLILEGLSKDVSAEQLSEIKSETEEFLDKIKTNEALKDLNIVPAEHAEKEELSNAISDSLIFGSNNKIKTDFTSIIKKLKLNIPDIIANQLLTVLNNKSDFIKLAVFLNNRDTRGTLLNESEPVLTLEQISSVLRFI